MRLLRTLFGGRKPDVVTAPPLPPAKDPAELMREMRSTWLTLGADQGTHMDKDDVIAVLMEWPLGKHTATVLASFIGDASLYTTGTFGVMGGMGQERVRNAATGLVGCAQRFLSLTTSTSEFPYPDGQTLSFYMVTPSCVRTVAFPMAAIAEEKSPASILFAHGQQVLTELRLTTERN